MRKLLDFLIRKRHWFLFLILEIISLALIYRNNGYQQNIMLSTANVVTANIVSVTGSITSYLNLREQNKDLQERNVRLEMDLLRLRGQMEKMRMDTLTFKGFATDPARQFPYDFVKAKVVNNSVTNLSTYITLNKGRKDGLQPDMGVVSERGVVGVISTVADHFSVIIPLLNPKFRLSCKVLGSSYFGSMGWNGRSSRYTNLDELPRHVEFQVGDTIVTSGYSALFPEGIMVGFVSSFEKQRDDNFYSLKVELSTDFNRLNHVMVIKNFYQVEQKRVEREARSHD
jgi:rod shape-determining protein MreC